MFVVQQFVSTKIEEFQTILNTRNEGALVTLSGSSFQNEVLLYEIGICKEVSLSYSWGAS